MMFTGERLIPDQQRDDDLYHEHMARYLFAAQFAQGRRTLDAGCGAGYGSALLAGAAAQSVVGVDIAEEAIAYARQRYQHPALSFAVADITTWDAAAASFDLIVSFEVIEHLANPAALAQTAARLLSPGGLFIVSTPNPAVYPPGNPFHKRELPEDEFASLLRQSFAAVSLFEEDYSAALAVRPRPPAQAALWRLTPAQERAARQPDYYIALCSHDQLALAQAIQTAHSIMYELPADRLGERIAAAQTLQALLDAQSRHLAEKDAHIAHLQDDLRRQSEWAAGLERRLKALNAAWYVRLFGRGG